MSSIVLVLNCYFSLNTCSIQIRLLKWNVIFDLFQLLQLPGISNWLLSHPQRLKRRGVRPWSLMVSSNVTWWGMVYQKMAWIKRCIPQPQSTYWPHWMSSLLTMFKSMLKRLFLGLPPIFFGQRQKKMVSAVIGCCYCCCCCCCLFLLWFSFINVCRWQPHVASK